MNFNQDFWSQMWNWWHDIEKYDFKYYENSICCPPTMCSEFQPSEFYISDPFSSINGSKLKKSDLQNEEDETVIVLGNDDYILSGHWRHQKRYGSGSLSGKRLEASGIKLIVGKYHNGWLQGKAKIFLNDDENTLLEGNFEKGILDGPVRGFSENGIDLKLVGFFYNGYPIGPFWKKLEGGGFLYGRMDKGAKFSGDNNAYIYPDFHTALLGVFDNDILKLGKSFFIHNIEIINQIINLKFIPNECTAEFKYLPSTLMEIRCCPLLQDPYEQNWVEVKKSNIEGAGDGLFSKSRIPCAGWTIAFYNGIRVRPGETPPFRSIHYEIYVDWINETKKKSDYMDLPEEFISTENYKASLGHKINHSFDPSCKWEVCHHPVFGRIPKIVSLRPIEAGEELTCHYMIDMQDAEVNDNLKWYLDRWEIESKRIPN